MDKLATFLGYNSPGGDGAAPSSKLVGELVSRLEVVTERSVTHPDFILSAWMGLHEVGDVSILEPTGSGPADEASDGDGASPASVVARAQLFRRIIRHRDRLLARIRRIAAAHDLCHWPMPVVEAEAPNISAPVTADQVAAVQRDVAATKSTVSGLVEAIGSNLDAEDRELLRRDFHRFRAQARRLAVSPTAQPEPPASSFEAVISAPVATAGGKSGDHVPRD